MKKRSIVCALILCLLAMCGCGEKSTPSYMGGHSFGDSQETVEKAGNAETIMNLKIKDWVYMYDPTELKTVVYEMDPSVTLEEAVKTFNEAFGEGSEGVRGDTYTEYTWVDGDNATIYVMKKIAPEEGEENNVIIQANRIRK